MDVIDFLRGGKPRYSLACQGLLCFLTVGTAQAQDGLDLLAETIGERVESRQEASVFLEQGDKAYRQGDFEKAVTAYSQAVSLLPRQAPAVRELRQAAVERYSQAAVQQARVLSRKGDYQAAEALLDRADAEEMAAGDPQVAQMREKILDPIRTNPALTPEHSANIDQVRRLLYQAEGAFNLGKFDESREQYQAVLRIDPYNKAARRGMERVSAQVSDAAGAAYDQTRAKMLQDLAAGWEMSAKGRPQVPVVGEYGSMESADQFRMATEKLKTIMIDQVDLSEASLEECVDYLREVTRRNDQATLDPEQRGLDFFVDLGSPDHPKVQEVLGKRVTLRLRNVPVQQVLKVICDMTGTQYRVDQFAVVIRPIGVADSTLMSRVFRVPPDFLTRDAINAENEERDPFSTDDDDGPLLRKRLTAEEKLKSLGVKFPEGASASFNPSNSQLRVRNTADQLDMIDQIASAASDSEPVAVVIRTRIVQIEQNSLEELGYDWVMSDVQLGGDGFLSGGTVGNGFESRDMVAGNPLTSGIRSGGSAVAADGLDRLLARPDIATPSGFYRENSFGEVETAANFTPENPLGATSLNRAPGILSLKQVIDGSVSQMMLTGLSQDKGADIMSMQEVVTRSGQAATIESIQEFIYPTEYEPPELPNSTGTTTLIDLLTGEQMSASSPGMVTPANPTAFEMVKLGTVLEVMPQVSADRKIINVTVKPTVREFEGFVNYGTPIVGSSSSLGFYNPYIPFVTPSIFRETVYGQLTPNRIEMPIFRTLRGNTDVSIADGHTLVIGGLLSSSVQKVEDGAPLLKDLPLLGRFFKNDVDSVQRKAVMIFLNVELLDPSGMPYRHR